MSTVLYVNPETKDVIAGNVTAGNIIATGNVGIGTTQPLAKLHVNGSFYASGCIVQVVMKKINTSTVVSVVGQYVTTVVSGAITPKYSTSTLLILMNAQFEWSGSIAGSGPFFQIRRDDIVDTDVIGPNSNTSGFCYINLASPDFYGKITLSTFYIANSTANTTFTLYANRHNSNTSLLYVGSPNGFGRSEVIIYEIAA